MGLYSIKGDSLELIEQTTYSEEQVRERQDLQRWLKNSIESIAPGCMVIDEEFNDWEDSNRRIDLLCLDQEACLVVIELKRTQRGGHMDLQAIRYAAMVSKMTFERAVRAHERYLRNNDQDPAQAEQQILNFLDWPEPYEEEFAPEVKIILASADFSTEITTSALWLREQQIDIRCVKISPHNHKGELIVQVDQVIPVQSAEDYQVREREKLSERKAARRSGRSSTGFAFVNVGEHSGKKNHRSWEGSRRYGYISAGGNSISQLDRLQVGQAVCAYRKGHGYVGVGIVTTEPTPYAEFAIESGDQKLADLPLEHSENPHFQREVYVGIRWIKTLDKEQAIKATPYRNTACQIHEGELVDEILAGFELTHDDCLE
jgi:hypothetical protein